jgi:hypothetical protein
MKYFILLNCLLFNFSLSVADEVGEKIKEVKSVEEYTQDDFELVKTQRLKRIRRELVQLNSEIKSINKELKGDIGMMSRIQNEAKLNNLELEYEKKKNLFIETITNINLGHDRRKKQKTTFSDDIKQILDPALNTFKRISEKPRQIQELSEEMESLQERYANAQEAKVKLDLFLKENTNKSLKWKLKESIKTTEELIKSLKVKLEDLQYKIVKIEENEESIVTTFSAIIFEFIKTKGKNLILSLIVFLTFFWLFKIGQAKFIDIVLFRVSRSNSKEVYNWIIRPTRVIYNVLTTFVSFFLSILTLYVLNDWVLVTLILITFAALIWSSKQYLPIFLEQSKIVLNLGSVREGERVIYNGLPWKIDSLGYYCKLSNPFLSGGSLRVNTKELINSHSRRADENEPWFPTREGDWVLIGESYGQVTLQSPEQVVLKLAGGETRYYPAKEYYQITPQNYSLGFAIDFVIGLDYNLQQNLFEEVIPKFRENIQKVLFQKHPELQGKVLDTQIDFLRANASSLDLKFFMKCSGDVAHMKLSLERSFQAECVKVCNENNYTIPFNQLTVHMNNG